MATKTKERASAAPQEAPAQTKSPKTTGSNGSAPLPEELLKRLYGYMLKCRTVEEKARTLFKQGRFAGNYYAAVGQEATEVGCTIDLRPEDIEVPPTFGTRVKVDYLLGMARSGKKFCLLLDTEKVLSTDELLELPDSLESGAESESGENQSEVLDLRDPVASDNDSAEASPE